MAETLSLVNFSFCSAPSLFSSSSPSVLSQLIFPFNHWAISAVKTLWAKHNQNNITLWAVTVSVSISKTLLNYDQWVDASDAAKATKQTLCRRPAAGTLGELVNNTVDFPFVVDKSLNNSIGSTWRSFRTVEKQDCIVWLLRLVSETSDQVFHCNKTRY